MSKPQLWDVWDNRGNHVRVACTRRELSAMCKASNPAWRRLGWIVSRVRRTKNSWHNCRVRRYYYKWWALERKHG